MTWGRGGGEEQWAGSSIALPLQYRQGDQSKYLQYHILGSKSWQLILDIKKINFQGCPPPSPAAVGSCACAALLPPGGGPGRGEGRPCQTLPPLSPTSSHLEGHQGRLSKPPSDANHCYHRKWISLYLPPASVGPLASFHPALRLRQTVAGAINPTF